MALFDRWAARSMSAGHLRLGDVKVLLRTMRAYRAALDAGDTPQRPPRRITRHWRLTLMYSLWASAEDSPTLFVAGCLCAIPALPILAWTLAGWVLRLGAWTLARFDLVGGA